MSVRSDGAPLHDEHTVEAIAGAAAAPKCARVAVEREIDPRTARTRGLTLMSDSFSSISAPPRLDAARASTPPPVAGARSGSPLTTSPLGEERSDRSTAQFTSNIFQN